MSFPEAPLRFLLAPLRLQHTLSAVQACRSAGFCSEHTRVCLGTKLLRSGEDRGSFVGFKQEEHPSLTSRCSPVQDVAAVLEVGAGGPERQGRCCEIPLGRRLETSLLARDLQEISAHEPCSKLRTIRTDRRCVSTGTCDVQRREGAEGAHWHQYAIPPKQGSPEKVFKRSKLLPVIRLFVLRACRAPKLRFVARGELNYEVVKSVHQVLSYAGDVASISALFSVCHEVHSSRSSAGNSVACSITSRVGIGSRTEQSSNDETCGHVACDVLTTLLA